MYVERSTFNNSSWLTIVSSSLIHVISALRKPVPTHQEAFLFNLKWCLPFARHKLFLTIYFTFYFSSTFYNISNSRGRCCQVRIRTWIDFLCSQTISGVCYNMSQSTGHCACKLCLGSNWVSGEWDCANHHMLSYNFVALFLPKTFLILSFCFHAMTVDRLIVTCAIYNGNVLCL